MLSALLVSAAENGDSARRAVYSWHLNANVRVPMRDGVKLATDLYMPDGAGIKLPAILIRTPYDRKARTEAEIGIRMALGAQPGKIFRMVTGWAVRLTLVGVALGFDNSRVRRNHRRLPSNALIESGALRLYVALSPIHAAPLPIRS